MRKPLSPAIEQVKTFHIAADVPVHSVPAFPNEARCKLRRHLLMEEFDEFTRALEARNMTECADALADIIYVAIGTALELGIPLAECWDEVQASNMAKIDPVTGKVVRREDGKILKPKGWQAPDIEGIIMDAILKGIDLGGPK
jgi:predicted HAD superfamily Cof-like phosphohydrolase